MKNTILETITETVESGTVEGMKITCNMPNKKVAVTKVIVGDNWNYRLEITIDGAKVHSANMTAFEINQFEELRFKMSKLSNEKDSREKDVTERIKTNQLISDYCELYRRFDREGDLAVHIEFELEGTPDQIKRNIIELIELARSEENYCDLCDIVINDASLCEGENCPVKAIMNKYKPIPLCAMCGDETDKDAHWIQDGLVFCNGECREVYDYINMEHPSVRDSIQRNRKTNGTT